MLFHLCEKRPCENKIDLLMTCKMQKFPSSASLHFYQHISGNRKSTKLWLGNIQLFIPPFSNNIL